MKRGREGWGGGMNSEEEGKERETASSVAFL